MEYNGFDRYGKYFEEFQEGDVYKHWPGRTITEAGNELFCMLTMNHMPLHIDADYAGKSQHGKILVVGLYVLSIVVGMSVIDTSGKTIAALDYEEIRHLAPTYVGDTIYGQSKVLDKRESRSRTDRGIIHIETKAFNQRGEEVLSLRRHFLVPKKEAAQVASP